MAHNYPNIARKCATGANTMRAIEYTIRIVAVSGRTTINVRGQTWSLETRPKLGIATGPNRSKLIFEITIKL